jgi:hypothetical protein
MATLTCREVVAFLMDYLAQSLDPAQRAAFEAHLVGSRRLDISRTPSSCSVSSTASSGSTSCGGAPSQSG